MWVGSVWVVGYRFLRNCGSVMVIESTLDLSLFKIKIIKPKSCELDGPEMSCSHPVAILFRPISWCQAVAKSLSKSQRSYAPSRAAGGVVEIHPAQSSWALAAQEVTNGATRKHLKPWSRCRCFSFRWSVDLHSSPWLTTSHHPASDDHEQFFFY